MSLPQRALLTGATGFIGWHLAARLRQEGCDTHAIVRPSSDAAELRQLLGEDRVHMHDGTTGDMLAIVERVRPHAVFHLASLFLAQHKPADVSALVHSNIEFGAQLAEASAAAGVPHFISTGTAWQHFADAEFNPVNLYAATKQAFVDIVRYYTESGVFRAVTLEFFGTYGPGDSRPKLFSALRKAAQTGESLAMSPGDQLIDLVYIDDVIDAYLGASTRFATSGARSETFAISSGQPRPVREVVELWSKITQRHLNIQWGAHPHRRRAMMHPWSRGTPLPDWLPKTSLEEGIRLMEAAGGNP